MQEKVKKIHRMIVVRIE